MDDVEIVSQDFNWSPVWCLMSLGGFYASKQILSHHVPANVASQGSKTAWKWVNIANSLIHSLITGIGALIW